MLDVAALVAEAAKYLGVPYELGGLRAHPNDPKRGLDCSELVALVFAKFGINLPWNAYQQSKVTRAVDTPEIGDLVFFRDTNPADKDPITHVGIYVGGGKMINAENKGVAIADITSGYWLEHLAGFGRVTEERKPVADPVGFDLPWKISNPLDPVGKLFDWIGGIVHTLTDPSFWKRALASVGGLALIVAGLFVAFFASDAGQGVIKVAAKGAKKAVVGAATGGAGAVVA